GPSGVIDMFNGQPSNSEPSNTPSIVSHTSNSNNDILPRLYRAFVLAITSAVLQSVAKRGDWFEFGNDSCLRIYEDLNAWVKNDDTDPRIHWNIIEQLCIDVRWSQSGTLTIGSQLVRLPEFSRLSDVLENRDVMARGSLRDGHSVFIAPFGTRCAIVDREKQGSNAFEADRGGKKSTEAWLDTLGIKCKPASSWVCLRIHDQRPRCGTLLSAPGGLQIWWPAHLCFIRYTSCHVNRKGVLDTIAEGTFIDPLEKAEQWFLRRKEREEVMEARRKEVEESKLQKTQSADARDSGFEESPADRMTQTNHYLSAQEASGIYPTPPDGLASHAASSVAAQDTPATSNPEVYPDPTTVNEASKVNITDNDSPQETMPEGRFTNDESQDLFGDMDTDMFDTNVLTEADFNFFDEPDDVEDPLEVIQDDYTGLNPPTLDSGEPPPGDGRGEVTQLDVAQLRALGENDMESVHREIASTQISPEKDEMTPPPSEGISTQYRVDEVEVASPIERHDLSQASTGKEKQSSFEVIAPEGRPQIFDAKYLQAGKYAASPPEKQVGQKPGQGLRASSSEIPRIGHLLETDELSSDETEDSLTDWDKEDLSTAISGLANVGMGSEGGSWCAKKRKREPSTESDCPETPAESVLSTQTDLEPTNDLNMCGTLEYSDHRALHDIIGLLEDQPADFDSIYLGTDQTFIQIAQLVTDQTTLQTGVFQLPLQLTQSPHELRTTVGLKSSQGLDHEILVEIFHDIKQCDLKRYHELDLSVASGLSQKTTSLQDDIEKRRQALLQSREPKGHNEAVYETQTPYLHVQRGQDAIHIAPPGFYFWEELGLAPSQQKKDVMAFCIYPDHRVLRGAASTFMNTMQSSYQNCKLGFHRDGVGESGKYVEGLVPVSVTRTDAGNFWDSLHKVSDQLGGYSDVIRKTCTELTTQGSEIPLDGADGTNIVIYLVDPFNDEVKLPYLCAAFLRLFTTYATGAKQAGMTSARDVVLQIVPLSFLANCDSLVMPPPKAYAKLAFEVYSRCSPAPSSDGTMPLPCTSGSAVCLAKPVPKTVSFQLSIQPPVGLLSSDPTLHLAYSWNTTQQWLTCAWTDNLGLTRWNATYCLGVARPDFWAAFAETVKEVLDTTKEMLQPASLLWRLYIVKDSDMHQQELDGKTSLSIRDLLVLIPSTLVWRHHSSIVSRQQVKILMLSIDTKPPLSFPTGRTNYDAIFPTTTPETTPAAHGLYEQMPTPDYSSPTVIHTPGRPTPNQPATPSAPGFSEADPSARLIDVVSKTWAMMSPTPIPDPYLGPPHLAAVLASGYLFKRAGAEEDDGLLPLGINLITTIISKPEAGNNFQANIKTLKEVLGMYSDLALLARLRGLEEWRTGILPWHVAAARKARRVVTRCMRWDERRS
ncbi:MAG: hypothetical protein Q9224_003854, partial [Gallowayella concinna]